MSDSTILNAEKSQYSATPSITNDDSSSNDREKQSAVKEQIVTDQSASKLDNKDEPAVGLGKTDEGETTPPSTKPIVQGEESTSHESSLGIEMGNSAGDNPLFEPSTFLFHNSSAVSAYHLNQKYDTLPPPYIPRAPTLYQSFIPLKRTHESISSDDETEYNYNEGLSSKRRKKGDLIKESDLNLQTSPALESRKSGRRSTSTSRSDHNATTLLTSQSVINAGKTTNGRKMITAPKTASKLQKLIPGFPTPKDPFPEDFTLTELCTQYPNHLFGENLYPFLQHGWSAVRIANLLPDQDGVAEDDKITANALASRIKKIKARLEKSGDYNLIVNGPKTHAETSPSPGEVQTDSEETEDGDETEDGAETEASEREDGIELAA